VTVINGPRQSGKTTLVRALVQLSGGYWSFDDATVRAAAELDPHGFVAQPPSPMAIDEVQRGGDGVVLAIKELVDRRSGPGQFILAGSTRFLSVPQLSESLAGRAEILDLWPLSQGEIIGVRERFIDVLLSDPDSLGGLRCEPVSRSELADRLVRGSYPELVDHDPRQSTRWYRSYVRTVVERDVIEASAITQAAELPSLLRLLAANTSGELVIARLAGDARMSVDTVARYVALLELVGFVVRIPAWTPSLTSREKRHAKGVITDSGLASSLLGQSSEALATRPDAPLGSILESFVTMELIKQRGWSERQPTIRHWRDRNGAEVDLVVEDASGAVGGVEVKASASVTTADARHLIDLRDRLGDRFVSGAVLYLGDRVVPLSPRIWALPVSALWGD
jgi:predicted AAA+ superfamily ATPase